MVKPKTRRTRTVAAALTDKVWIRDIVGRATVSGIRQYVQLWHTVATVHLQAGVEDVISWRWEACRTYSARSAYHMFFRGSTVSPIFRTVWCTWAPLKVKFFICLAAKGRIWTAARRKRHGLQNTDECNLCGQEAETVDHLFSHCDYSRQVWLHVGLMTNNQLPNLTPNSNLIDWWLSIRANMTNIKARGLDSTVMLVCWRLWKERNGRAFATDVARTPQQLMPLIIEEASLWAQSGARNMEAFGWKPPNH